MSKYSRKIEKLQQLDSDLHELEIMADALGLGARDRQFRLKHPVKVRFFYVDYKETKIPTRIFPALKAVIENECQQIRLEIVDLMLEQEA